MPLGRKTEAVKSDKAFAKLKAQKRETKTVQRGDEVIDSTPVTANLLSVKKPRFITAVGLPANETAFKVVRDDKSEPATQPVLRRRLQRSEKSPVLRLAFPADMDEAAVNEALKEYGLEGYRVEQQDGVFLATRADLKSITNDVTNITLAEGLVATVARMDSGGKEPKSKLTISSIEFDSKKFTLDEVQRWVQEKGVDGTVQETQNPDECHVVRRGDVPENEETRRMVLEDGVQAVIMRSDVMDIPDGFIAVVNETAYTGWGWGQLDFLAAMGDQEFGEAMRQALYTLDEVLRQIVFYSYLPLDIRKELADRALAQFSAYIGNVMDSLPRQLLVSVVRSANTQQEKDMTQKSDGAAATKESVTKETKVVATSDAGAKDEPKTEVKTEVKDDGTPITRADVQTMIDAAVTKAVEATALAVRAELAPAKTEEAKTDAAETKTEAKTEPDTITRAELKEALAAVVAPMTEAIKGLQGTTVLRSAEEALPEKNDGKTRDVFRGAFEGLRTVKK